MYKIQIINIAFLYRIFLLYIFLLNTVSADCNFQVSNYTDYTVIVKAGFFAHESSILFIPNSASRFISIKSKFNCLSYTSGLTGIAFIDLIRGNSFGGWRYNLNNNIIRAYGVTKSNAEFAIGKNPQGYFIALINNYLPEKDSFSVMIKPSQFRPSKSASSN